MADELEARFEANHSLLVAARDRLQAAVDADTARSRRYSRFGRFQGCWRTSG